MRFIDSLPMVGPGNRPMSRWHHASRSPGIGRRAAALLLAQLLFASGLVACAKDAAQPEAETLPDGVVPTVAFENEAEAEFQAGAEIPIPGEAAILTIVGDLRSKNDEDSLSLDLEALKKLGTVAYSTTIPGSSKAVRYEGVLLTTILRVAGNTQAVAITAYVDDDHDARIPVQAVLDQPVCWPSRRMASRWRAQKRRCASSFPSKRWMTRPLRPKWPSVAWSGSSSTDRCLRRHGVGVGGGVQTRFSMSSSNSL